MIKVEPAVLPRFVFTDYGARVALQRCPILRAVKTLSRESTSHALRWSSICSGRAGVVIWLGAAGSTKEELLVG